MWCFLLVRKQKQRKEVSLKVQLSSQSLLLVDPHLPQPAVVVFFAAVVEAFVGGCIEGFVATVEPTVEEFVVVLLVVQLVELERSL